MTFDVARFKAASLRLREEDVPVPALAAWFGKDASPVWRVRALTAAELASAEDASKRKEDITMVIKAIVNDAAKVDSIRNELGLGDHTPHEIAKRMEMLVTGSVSPVIDLEAAVKLAQYFPIEFYQLTNKITTITSMGAEPGKSPPSGKGKTSKQA